jgi:hypothetical protein
MIPMTMIGKVRRMFHRQNKSVREIARLTSLSRNTMWRDNLDERRATIRMRMSRRG